MDIAFTDFFVEPAYFSWGLRSFLSAALVAFCLAAIGSFTLLLAPAQRKRILVAGSPIWIASLGILGVFFVMGLFGGVVGFHGGNSREGVVGDLMPAVVTLVAGFAAYLFGVSEKPASPLMFPLLGVFVASLFVTYSMGSANRGANQDQRYFDEQCLRIFGEPDLLNDSAGLLAAARAHVHTCPLEAGLVLSEEDFENARTRGTELYQRYID